MTLPANPWLRATAWLFDTSLALIPASALATAATLPARLRLMDSAPADLDHYEPLLRYLTQWAWVMGAQAALCLFFVTLIYGVGSALAEGGFHQATWGKRLVGLQVERLNGEDMTWQHAGLRFAAGALCWGSLNVGHAMAQFRADRRMLHDLVTQTRVVQEPIEHRTRGVAICLGVWMAVTLVMASLTPVDPVLARLAEHAQQQALVR